MELKKFIAESIEQVIQGVLDARENLKEHGQSVVAPPIAWTDGTNPDVLFIARKTEYSPSPSLRAWPLNFCVTINAVETSETGGEAKLNVGFMSIGAGLDAGKSEQREKAEGATLSFTVPINWPAE